MSLANDASRLVQLKEKAAAVSGRISTVALLYGGDCGEREISIASGKNVKEVLEKEGFPVLFIDTKDPRFLDQLIAGKPDVVFIALHGKCGEDGCVQGLLEMLNIPYTHSDVASSAFAMNKGVSKIIYEAHNLATAAFVEIEKGREPSSAELDAILAKVGLPCVVKPSEDGSSLGVTIAKNREGVLRAMEEGFVFGDVLLIEEFIKGVEVTVPVIGNKKGELLALPIVEIVPKNEFYDFESKYAEGGSTHITPARISLAEAELCKAAAIKAHEVLGCAGLSRTDIIVCASGTPWLIETNTVPGMTPTSLVPDSARHYGLTDGELYRLLLYFALETR